MTALPAASPPVTRASVRTAWPALLGAFVLGLLVLLVALALTGRGGGGVAGLPDAGGVTSWALPAFRYATDLAGTVTVGFLLLSVALLPVRGRDLDAPNYRALQRASAASATWAVLSLASSVLVLSDILGQPLSTTLRPDVLRAFLLEFPQPVAFLLVAAGAGVLAVATRLTTTSSWAALLLGLSFLLLLPPLLTGHASVAASHDTATSAAILHGVGVAAWVGGLVALVWAFGRAAPGTDLATRRFSLLAAWCFGVVAVGGVVSAAVRLTSPSDLVTTTYGRMVLLKVAALAALGVLGAWHRRRTLPALTSAASAAPATAGRRTADRRPFYRLAVGEVAVMAGAIGLAVALAMTAPPVPDEAGAYPDTADVLLGYVLEPSPTLGDLLTTWRFDPLVVVLLGIAGTLYAIGVRRLVRAGVRWPVGRSVSWYLGLGLLLVATCSGFAAYAPAMFSVHMIQHMTMTMFAPIALVLAAPVTLALRALPTAPRPAGRAEEPVRGLREWILVGLHSPLARFFTHPIVAFVIFVSSTYMIYFTGLYEVALRNHWAHLAMYGHFLLAGLLFSYVVIGVDPGPRSLPYWQRIVMLLATTPFHAYFGIALMSSSELIAESWFLGLGWYPPDELLADQSLGGGIAWAVGELVVLVMATAIFVQWVRSDAREARRTDRAADRAAERTRQRAASHPGAPGTAEVDPNDDLALYNAWLAQLAERDRTAGRG